MIERLWGEIEALKAARSLLAWDRQVMMPPGGVAARAAHAARLAAMLHERTTSDEFARAAELCDEPLRSRLLDDHRRASLYPASLVARRAAASEEAYAAWRTARAAEDFPAYAPFLECQVDLAREAAACAGFGRPYDGLLDAFEPGVTTEETTALFATLVPALREMISGRVPTDDPLADPFPADALRDLAASLAAEMGFDFGRGRLDLCGNAFCTTLSPNDVRMTTRPSGHFRGVFSSTMHELGHALYEAAVPADLARTALGGGISLAVHESSSRFWENMVARSDGFWRWAFPRAAAAFPGLAPLGPEGMARALRRVHPDPIRVGSDELHYNLHIALRFRMEVALIEGGLAVLDLPEAWDAAFEELFGRRPERPSLGVLQDVHWSRGSFGYFPTYAMGNVIAGGYQAGLTRDLGDLDALYEKGEFGPVREWLTKRVYRHGRSLDVRPLVEGAIGSYLDPAPFLAYLRTRYV